MYEDFFTYKLCTGCGVSGKMLFLNRNGILCVMHRIQTIVQKVWCYNARNACGGAIEAVADAIIIIVP